jgi:hypothetical protein
MTKKRHSVPKKMRVKYEAIVGMTDAFCQAHLNEEYEAYRLGLIPYLPE